MQSVANTDEIIELAKQAGFYSHLEMYYDEEMLAKFFRLAYARGMLKAEKQYMQLFLDPENQPTQFGTATEEYREQELKEAKTLLKELAHIVRTTHLYGPEMKKILEKEEVINGEASSSL